MSSKFEIKIEGIEEFRAAFGRAPEIVSKALIAAIKHVPDVLAKYTVVGIVPYRTGFLIQSFKRSVDGLEAHWFPTRKYAPFVEFGTSPHVIVPVNKKALYWKGAAHPVKKVNHPGSKANPYMERIRSASTTEINSVFKEALDKVVAYLAKQ